MVRAGEVKTRKWGTEWMVDRVASLADLKRGPWSTSSWRSQSLLIQFSCSVGVHRTSCGGLGRCAGIYAILPTHRGVVGRLKAIMASSDALVAVLSSITSAYEGLAYPLRPFRLC